MSYRPVKMGPLRGDVGVCEDPRAQPLHGDPPNVYRLTYLRLCRSCREELLGELLNLLEFPR